jgi:hypothetical protein
MNQHKDDSDQTQIDLLGLLKSLGFVFSEENNAWMHSEHGMGFTSQIEVRVLKRIIDSVHQRDKARDTRIKDPTLQDVIEAGIFPTPGEYEKMIWMLNWYRDQLIGGKTNV